MAEETLSENTLEDHGAVSDERQQLLVALAKKPITKDVIPAYFGFAHVAPIESLRALISAPPLDQLQIDDAVRAWKRRPAFRPSEIDYTSQPSWSAPDLLRRRDNDRCLVCNGPNTVGCYIVPQWLIGDKFPVERDRLLHVVQTWFGVEYREYLRDFLTADGVKPQEPQAGDPITLSEYEKLSRAYEQAQVRAMISLCANHYSHWNRAAFALKPTRISEDNTTLILTLFYQPLRCRKSSTRLPVYSHRDPCQTFLKQRDFQVSHETEPKHGWVIDNIYYVKHDTGTADETASPTILVRKSGDEIVMKTADPLTYPLPDHRLLMLAYWMAQIVRMRGAGEEEDDGEGYDYVNGDRDVVNHEHHRPTKEYINIDRNLRAGSEESQVDIGHWREHVHQSALISAHQATYASDRE